MTSPRDAKVRRLEDRIELLGDSPSGKLAARQLEELQDQEREEMGDPNDESPY